VDVALPRDNAQDDRRPFSRATLRRIGEGLILDLRTTVFDHVQRMPVAFFTRTRTGAFVSRLNNDVIGAQHAFSDTLSGVVANLVALALTLALTLAVMLNLSWQITLLALVLLPVFVVPRDGWGRGSPGWSGRPPSTTPR
jgi:ATP-binding cassette subfamily B protein